VTIGDSVVTVGRIHCGEVRLCIDAPRKVRIMRDELPVKTGLDVKRILKMVQEIKAAASDERLFEIVAEAMG
jgi:sRNA-binding carbon storage regulator CsrA